MRRTPAPVPPAVRPGRRWTATVLAVPALLAGTALIPGAATAAPAAWTPKPAPLTTPVPAPRSEAGTHPTPQPSTAR